MCLGCVHTKSGAASNPGRVVWRLCGVCVVIKITGPTVWRRVALRWGQIAKTHDWLPLCDQKKWFSFHYRWTHLNQTRCGALSALHSFPAPLLGFDPEVQQHKSSRRRSRRRRMWQNMTKKTTWWVLWTWIGWFAFGMLVFWNEEIFCICIFCQTYQPVMMVVQNWHHIHLPWQQHHQQWPLSSLSECLSASGVV